MSVEKVADINVLDKGEKLLPAGKVDTSLLRKASNYHVDLDDLEKISQKNTQKDAKIADKQDKYLNWKELDVKLVDIANLVFDSANYPVFIVQDDSLVYINQNARKVINLVQGNDILGTRFLNLVCKED